MIVESFYCEHTSKLFKGKKPGQAALEHALELLNTNYKNGLMYKCNYDAFVNKK